MKKPPISGAKSTPCRQAVESSTPKSDVDPNSKKAEQTPLSVSASSWDVCDGDDLALEGRDPIPYDTLVASGIPKDVADQLNYKNLTPDDVDEILGFRRQGCWGVKYTNPDGTDVLCDGEPFWRVRLPDGSKPKYLSPKGKGNRIYFSPLLKQEALASKKPIFITEGEKCADSANHHGFPTVGLSGVCSWKDKAHPHGLPELREIKLSAGRKVYLVFDSDISTNEHVENAAQALAKHLATPGPDSCQVFILQLPCELDGSKNGVDDFLARYGADALTRLVKISSLAGKWEQSEGSPPEWIRLWKPEPKNVHFVATLVASVMPLHFAENPDRGMLQWRQTHWQSLSGKTPLRKPIHLWMDHMHFHQRGNRIADIEKEATAYLEHRDWDRRSLMSFRNGTLDTKSWAFDPTHRQSDRLTHAFTYDYDPRATCPTWLGFLSQTFDDPQIIEFLQAQIRWTLIPKDRDQPFRHDRCVDIEGPRGCGKGTISEVLTALCGGGHGVGLLRSQSVADPNALAGLVGKKAAIDPDASGVIGDPGLFNSIVSNEPVSVKVLYRDLISTRLGVVVWRFYNDSPKIKNTGGVEGYGRRVVTLSIKHKPKHRDTSLKARLLAEIPGIFQWAISMPEHQMHQALESVGGIATIQAASVDALLKVNHWLRFLLESYPDGYVDPHDPDRTEISARHLYSVYCGWMKQEGHQPTTNTTFGESIKRLVRVNSYDLDPALPMHKKRTKHGWVYTIRPMKDLNLVDFFGVDAGSADPDCAPVHGQKPGYSPQEPLPGGSSQGLVHRVHSASHSLPTGARAPRSPAIEKGLGSNHAPRTPGGLRTNQELVELAVQAGCVSVDQIIDWVPRNLHTKVGRRDAERCLRKVMTHPGPD